MLPTTVTFDDAVKAALIRHLETAQRFYMAEADPLSKRTKAYRELTANAVSAGALADQIEAAKGDITFNV